MMTRVTRNISDPQTPKKVPRGVSNNENQSTPCKPLNSNQSLDRIFHGTLPPPQCPRTPLKRRWSISECQTPPNENRKPNIDGLERAILSVKSNRISSISCGKKE